MGSSKEVIKERLLLFFDFQGEDGNIVDGYTEIDTEAGYDYIFSETAPDYKAHKNTVETDQESSLILAIARYIETSGDTKILYEEKNGKYEYLKHLSTEGALVQERPIAEFEGSGYTDKIHPPWSEGWVWTGDQGMLVAAIYDMIAVKDELAGFVAIKNLAAEFDVDVFEKEATGIIRSIGEGVKNALIADVDGIIREAPCLSSFGPVHGGDYLAGRGIMMRYLGAEEVKPKLGVDLDKAYVEQFRRLWGLADEVHKWNLEPMPVEHKNGVCQAVGLDMLGAAIKALD